MGAVHVHRSPGGLIRPACTCDAPPDVELEEAPPALTADPVFASSAVPWLWDRSPRRRDVLVADLERRLTNSGGRVGRFIWSTGRKVIRILLDVFALLLALVLFPVLRTFAIRINAILTIAGIMAIAVAGYLVNPIAGYALAGIGLVYVGFER